WETLSKIKFVPSKPIDPPFHETAYSKVPELQCFSLLCLPEYKYVCWTQCSIYDDDVLPNTTVCNQFPEMGKADLNVIINHLYTIKSIVRADLSEWKKPKLSKLLKQVIHQIYWRLNNGRSLTLKSCLA